MKKIVKLKKPIALGLVVIFLSTLSYSNASGGSVGAYSANRYEGAVPLQQSEAAWLASAVAFGIGVVTGAAVGLVEGFTVGTQLVDAFGTQETSSLQLINYDTTNLSEFDPE